MNIFVLDLEPHLAAQYHADKHVVKMVLETAQILCTVLNKMGYTTPYRSSHIHHPCVKWAAKSYENYIWLKNLGLELGAEYTYRYGKIHKCFEVIVNLPSPDFNEFLENEATPFAQAMPDIYKNQEDTVAAYRNYYVGAKKDLLKYTKRKMPGWLKE